MIVRSSNNVYTRPFALGIPNCIAKHNGVGIGQKVYCFSSVKKSTKYF